MIFRVALVIKYTAQLQRSRAVSFICPQGIHCNILYESQRSLDKHITYKRHSKEFPLPKRVLENMPRSKKHFYMVHLICNTSHIT